MYKSIKLAMVMTIVLAVSGCIIAVSDENDAVEYTPVNSTNLSDYLSEDGTGYQMTGNLRLDGVTLDKPVTVQDSLDLNVDKENVSNTTFIIGTGSTLTLSGTATAVTFDIDGGTLIINSNISVKGSMDGGTILNNAQITIKTTFAVSSGQIVNNDKITSQVESPSSRSDYLTNNGLFVEYTKSGEEFSLTKVSTGTGVTGMGVSLTNKIDRCPVTSIGESAFENCLGVTSVMKPISNNNSLTSIDDKAFSGCSNLEQVILNKVTSIGNDVFNGCSNLTQLKFESLAKIDENTFEGCTSLKSLTVSESCEIPSGAFLGFNDLTVEKGETKYYVDADGNLTQTNAENANFAIHQNNKIYYDLDFDNAVASASSGSTVRLLKDATIEPIQIEKTILTIDLNGKKLTIGNSVSPDNTSTYGIDFVGGTLTIKNGTIEDARDTSRTGGCTAINSVGNLNIENVNLVIYDAANSSNSNNIGYRISNGQTLTMSGNSTVKTDSTAEADRGSVGVVVLGIGNSVNTTNLILKDNASIEVGQYGISGNARNAGDGIGDYGGTTITIMDDAKVSASNGWGIYHPQSGSLNIQDNAEITGLTGIEIRSGTLNMTGGEVRSTATANTMVVDPNSGGATTTGVGISVVQHTTKQDIDVDIDAGKVSGFFAVFQADIPGNGSESMEKVDIKLNGGSYESTGTEEITTNGKTYSPSSVYGEEKKDMVVGGSYDSDVSDYAAPGFAVVPNSDGTYGPVESEFSEDTVNENGQTVQATVSGDTVTIPVADEGFSDITFDLSFGSTEITIVGDVEKDVTIRYYTLDSTEAELAFELYIDGVVKEGMGVVVAVPVILGENESIDTDTLYAYSVTDQVQNPETVYVSGDHIVVVTDHNTPFYVNYDVVNTVPYPPIWDDDDDYVPPVVPSQTDDSGDDSTTEIVACAAAAVVAALMAAFLIMTYRKD